MASPPPSSSSKKPHLAFPGKPSNFQKIPSKSHSNSICKTLIVLFLLLLIPFFPSQAPDFIAQKLSTQFWEIIHLLFIGIAVSYGLFGRRSDPKIQIEISTLDDDDDSQAYLSGISHLSSVFEDGPHEQEQDLMQSYFANCNCQCVGDPILGQSRCALHGGSVSAEVRSFVVSNNAREGVTCDGNEKNVKKNQTWSSKYSKGESLVVVANANGGSLDFKPLNLPVRSLRSSVVDSDKSEPSLEIEAKGRKETKVPKIRGVVPVNLEKRFKDPNGLSPIPWRSRSVGMGNDDGYDYDDDEEEESNVIKTRVHCRPHSVGDFEFERIMSRPSNEVKVLSTSPELRNLRKGDAEGENVTSVPRPKIAPLAGFGDRNCEEHKEVGKGKQPIEPLQVDTKPLAFRAKALPRRAKSVRTIKPTRHIAMNQKAEKPLAYRQHEEVDRRFSMTKPKPKPSLPDFFMEEASVDQNVTEESEADRVSELKDSSDEEEKEDEEEDAKTNIDYDLGSEVDRKAGEFIAKFREQIRHQKASSSVGGYSQEFL